MPNLITKGHAIAGKLTVKTGGAALNGAVTINEDGGDYDFRVEADNNTNAMNVDAGLFTGVGAVGVGSAAVNTAAVTVDPPALTAVAATNYAKLRVDNTAAVT
ncbi:MAG: hypothetical protein Q7T33_02595, partial [Dehalococcoidia bacterium]|nr:hypothetical protein [Dehalococcoidia bacterium]